MADEARMGRLLFTCHRGRLCRIVGVLGLLLSAVIGLPPTDVPVFSRTTGIILAIGAGFILRHGWRYRKKKFECYEKGLRDSGRFVFDDDIEMMTANLFRPSPWPILLFGGVGEILLRLQVLGLRDVPRTRDVLVFEGNNREGPFRFTVGWCDDSPNREQVRLLTRRVEKAIARRMWMEIAETGHTPWLSDSVILRNGVAFGDSGEFVSIEEMRAARLQDGVLEIDLDSGFERIVPAVEPNFYPGWFLLQAREQRQ